jgi:hypothetical protein
LIKIYFSAVLAVWFSNCQFLFIHHLVRESLSDRLLDRAFFLRERQPLQGQQRLDHVVAHPRGLYYLYPNPSEPQGSGRR